MKLIHRKIYNFYSILRSIKKLPLKLKLYHYTLYICERNILYLSLSFRSEIIDKHVKYDVIHFITNYMNF